MTPRAEHRWAWSVWIVVATWAGAQLVRASEEVGALPKVEGVARDWAPPQTHALGEVIDARPLRLQVELAERYGAQLQLPASTELRAWSAALSDAGIATASGPSSATPRLVVSPDLGPLLVVAPFGQQWVVAVPDVGVVVTAVDALPESWPTLTLPTLQERPY